MYTSSSRGRDSRLRGSGSWRGYGNRVNPPREAPRHPSPPFGTLIESLSGNDAKAGGLLRRQRTTYAEITHCAHIASFNWVDSKRPVILIPGMPPAWTPLDEPRKLKEDAGDYYRDQNAARSPKHPMEASVHAIFADNESFDTQSIDLFACSGTMGSLLRFVRQIDKPFRFFVEAVGNTVFFIRHENSPTELLEGVKGYGHTFPEAYTTWDSEVKGSASHQRLLKYRFSGLICVYRFEADGYFLSDTTKTVKAQESDDIASILDGMHVTSSKAAATDYGQIEIRQAGRAIPHDSVFDLKTRSVRNPRDVMADELPRFWVSQMPNLVLARHNNGVFQEIQVKSIEDDIDDWEEENQEIIHQFSWLLHKIIAVARGRKDGKLEVRRKDVSILELREQNTTEHEVLPPELKQRWKRDKAESASPSADDKSSDGADHAPGSPDSGHNDAYHDFPSDDESEKDFTACSADDCGYCGHCSY